MVRKVICVEGKEFQGMKTIAMPGSIYVEDADTKIPVLAASDQTKILGYATGLKRDISSGEVSMDLTIHPRFDVNLDEFDATVTLSPVMTAKGKDDESLTIINSGRLRAVSLTWERPA